MKSKLLLILCLSVCSSMAWSTSNEQYPLEKADINLHNSATLQRGAKYFVNYCLSCHSAKYSRYNRIAEDLGIPEDIARKNLMFTQQKFADLMTISMTAENSLQWFGAEPPDLTLVARSRSPDWLYTYLKTFYVDESRPLGVNNVLFQNVAMPHALWELQGWQKPIYKTVTAPDGTVSEVISGFELIKPGLLSDKEYNRVVLDIVSFLAYLSEPIASYRKNIGIYIMLFLLVLLGICYGLKYEYWKDID